MKKITNIFKKHRSTQPATTSKQKPVMTVEKATRIVVDQYGDALMQLKDT